MIDSHWEPREGQTASHFSDRRSKISRTFGMFWRNTIERKCDILTCCLTRHHRHTYFRVVFPTDPPPPTGISPRDQRWVGAWWVGLLVIAAVVGLYGWLISLFPRQLSTDHLSEKQQQQQLETARQASVRPSRAGGQGGGVLVCTTLMLWFYVVL